MFRFNIRQTRFIVFASATHSLNLHADRRLLFVISKCCTCLAIYIAMAIKSGCVIVWKVIMTVEAAGLRGSRHNSKLVAQLKALATSNTIMVHLAVFSAFSADRN